MIGGKQTPRYHHVIILILIWSSMNRKVVAFSVITTRVYTDYTVNEQIKMKFIYLFLQGGSTKRSCSPLQLL